MELEASGFVFRDARQRRRRHVRARASRGSTTATLDRFATSDLVLVDGTFWRDDELPGLGFSTRSARDMGHLPLSGPGGTLEALAGLDRPRKALVHINNTNPILLEDSPERDAVLRAGVEVAYDGLEVEL